MDSALKEIDKCGYSDLSLDSVFEAAGISVEEGQKLIPSKEDLLLGLHEFVINDLISDFREILGRQTSALTKLNLVAEKIVWIAAERRMHVSIILKEYQYISDPMIKQKIRAKRKEFEQIVVGLIEEGIREGNFVEEDPFLLAMAFLGMVNWTYAWYRPGHDKHQIGRIFSMIFTKGVLRPEL